MSSTTLSDNYTTLVSRVMIVEDVTWGDPKIRFWDDPGIGYIVRFRGALLQDQANAQANLEQWLRPQNISPIFRSDNGLTSIYLVGDPLTAQVSQILNIQETHWAEPQALHIVRYLGHLRMDSVEAYDKISEAMTSREITPLFRIEQGQHAIILVKGVNKPTPSNPWINVAMFILTVISVSLVGALNVYSGPANSISEIYWGAFSELQAGLPFALSLLAILLAHEFGHYIAGRLHKTPVTLPYFIPMPLPPFGTLGAFIQLKAAPKNKRILLDIGVAGPLAGFIIAIPILLYGLSLSQIQPIPENVAIQMEGTSIIYLLAKYIVFGEWLPAPFSYGDVHPIWYWIQYMFTGRPFPIGGQDVFLHPIAWAGWGGLLVTALNLIPAGQLDGGHLAYVLFGHRARQILPYILVGLLILGFVWQGWWLWLFFISLLGRAYAEPLDQITPLDPRRKVVAILGLIVFILTFTPVPLQAF
ncbi:MAG: site-2 protease family protein [Anaerolineales bacterium]